MHFEERPVERPTAVSLFSGIGGIDLAAERAGFRVVVMVEKDPFCREVLRRRFPDAILYSDVKHITRQKIISKLYQKGVLKRDPAHGPVVDLVFGGYPCQPISVAGKQLGEADDRWLWPEVDRINAALRPTWFLGENVANHVKVGLDGVLADLEAQGYACWPLLLPACAVGAPQGRERTFIVAHAESERVQGSRSLGEQEPPLPAGEGVSGCNSPGGGTADGRPQPGMGGSSDGVPTWMDGHRWPAHRREPQHEWEPPRVLANVPRRKDRLKALGNAVVPAQVYPILEAIHEQISAAKTVYTASALNAVLAEARQAVQLSDWIAVGEALGPLLDEPGARFPSLLGIVHTIDEQIKPNLVEVRRRIHGGLPHCYQVVQGILVAPEMDEPAQLPA